MHAGQAAVSFAEPHFSSLCWFVFKRTCIKKEKNRQRRTGRNVEEPAFTLMSTLALVVWSSDPLRVLGKGPGSLAHTRYSIGGRAQGQPL